MAASAAANVGARASCCCHCCCHHHPTKRTDAPILRFEDTDFLGELCKKPEDQEMQVVELLRDEAVEVWKEYATFTDVQHY